MTWFFLALFLLALIFWGLGYLVLKKIVDFVISRVTNR